MKPLVGKNGTKYWYNANGQLHREDGPAIEYLNGKKCWFINGIKKNPVIINRSGTKQWYNSDDQLHRETSSR